MRQYSLVTVLVCTAIVLALLFAPSPIDAQLPGSGLEDLREFKIVVEDLDRDAEAERISRRILEDQVLVTVRSRAPGLRYDPGVIPYLYVYLSILSSPIGYAGNLSLEFARPVEVLGGVHRHFDVPSRRIWAVATVWNDAFTFQVRYAPLFPNVRQGSAGVDGIAGDRITPVPRKFRQINLR
jgi:hypothetical protein